MPTPDACPSVANVVGRVDGGLVRIRVPGGRITAAQLATVADLAPGPVEITVRANLQLRGVSGSLLEELVAAGLSDGPEGDLARGVVAAPLDDAAQALVGPVVAALAGVPGLSPKFGVHVDGTGALAGRRDDVVVHAVGDRWSVVSAAGRAEVAVADVPAAVASAAATTVGRARRTVALPGTPIGVGPLGAGVGWSGAMPWLGRTDADGLRALATPGADVWLTPWRGVVAGVAAVRWPAGWVTDPCDPRAWVAACVGRAGCTSAVTDAPTDASRFVPATPTAPVHVAGCAKGCGALPGARLHLGRPDGTYEVVPA